MSDIARLSDRTRLARVAGPALLDLDAERRARRRARAKHADVRFEDRRPVTGAARRRRPSPDSVGQPALGRDGPGAA